MFDDQIASASMDLPSYPIQYHFNIFNPLKASKTQ